MPNFISEADIEQAILQNLHDIHGYELLDCFTADPENLNDGSNRADKRDVILEDLLREAVLRLNRHLPEAVIEGALSQLTDKRQAMAPVAANQEIDGLVRDGIPVVYEDDNGRTQHDHVRVIDFKDPAQNRYLAVSQLWVKGEIRFRRPDILLYVNGLPLVFIELKNSNIKLKSAFDDNLTNYKHDVPQLFLTNAFCMLSNGIKTRVGSFTAGWEHFFNWLRAADEREKVNRSAIREKGTSLEIAVAGLCAPVRLLDYVENFVLFYNDNQKIIAQNHQFLGVNKAYDQFLRRDDLGGRLGVFWHTQGAGKSFSMIFYVRKIFRKQTGNFSFVVVTDREDLDGQIYRNFLNTGTVKKSDAAQPKNSEEMRKFLGLNKRLVFTLIQKFRWPKGKAYPLLSDRDDIVVIVDEAHRTQYKTLAENMRAGLPRAQYLAFTGTPLLGRERKTNAWFGDYVSEYNFQQSMDDGATVPLFYQKRVPEVLIQNEDLNEEFYDILEDEHLDDVQQAKLEREFATELEVIRRDDRLEIIAKDIVAHFPRRGYLGKGLMVAVDKFTAVKMYDKVQLGWKQQIKTLMGRIAKTGDALEKQRLKQRLDYMRSVEMAVVISEEAGEEKKFAERGLVIKPHRERMDRLDDHGHDIEYNFKDPQHPLQLVFVCAMWLTGFDAPTLSTLYLDKPMKDHTLMQTIARANRVSSFRINRVAKANGEIVDYYNVFRNMKKALKEYAQGQEGLDDPPVREKAELFKLLDEAINQGLAFCRDKEIDLPVILAERKVFNNINQFNVFADLLLSRDEWRKGFQVHENTISLFYEACKPEILGSSRQPIIAVFQYLRGVIDSIIGQQDVDSAKQRIGTLLDESVVVDGNDYDGRPAGQPHPEFQIVQTGRTWNLSKIDFDKLREEFHGSPFKNIQIADLRKFIQQKLDAMIRQNVTRIDFAQRYQAIIDAYNAGGSSTENFYTDLMNFTRGMQAEAERHVREGLSEDELELFDLLKKDRMTKEETQRVKLAARSLLRRLVEEHPKVLVQDWFKDTQSQLTVRDAVEKVLDDNLPDSYDRALFKKKCDNVYELIFDHASKGRKWAA